MTPAEKRAEMRKVNSYIKRVENVINTMGIYARVEYRYPFDSVALSTLSKVFALARSCISLLFGGFSDEAYGLARSIVECSANLRYLTADIDLQDKRTRDFARYALADKAYWAHYALQQFAGKKEEDDIRAYMKQEGISPDPKSARRHWSGLGGFIWDVMTLAHPLDGPVTDVHKKMAYAADYFQTSAFVHCSLPAIDNYFVGSASCFRVSASSELHETFQSTLFIVLIYVHSALAYALYGMRIDRSPELTDAFSHTIQKMKPVERRHARR